MRYFASRPSLEGVLDYAPAHRNSESTKRTAYNIPLVSFFSTFESNYV